MMDRERYDDVGTIDAEDVSSGEPVLRAGPPYPSRVSPKALRGIFGQLVEVLEPHTEADPIALLIQALAAFGSVIGRNAFFVADGTKHYPNIYAVLVAPTSKGRKGTSWSHIRACFASIDPT